MERRKIWWPRTPWSPDDYVDRNWRMAREHWLHRAHGEDVIYPREIRLELVEGCLLRCRHCGIAGIRGESDDSLSVMQQWVWQKVAQEVRERKWSSRIVLTGRGEPAMHPFLDRVATEIQERAPRRPIWMETSGMGLVRTDLRSELPLVTSVINNIHVYLEAGINVVILARRPGYTKVWDTVWAWRDVISEHCNVDILRDWSGRPDRWGRKFLEIRLVPDVRRVRGETDQPAWSGAGAGAEPWYLRRKQRHCYRPIRQMCIRYDGRVQLCSEDWRGEICLGDLTHQSLYDIFYSDLARSVRRRALVGRRDLRPCSGCDAVGWPSYEAPLLDLPAPLDEVRVRTALAHGCMTRPVLRPWETRS